MPDKFRTYLSVNPTRFRWHPVLLLNIASMATLFGCRTSMTEHPANKAKARLVNNAHCEGYTREIGGEFNYGFKATATVQNIGQSGFISITVYLSSSEGEWSRSEELILCGGESRTLSYFFQEPTRHANNIQCRATVTP